MKLNQLKVRPEHRLEREGKERRQDFRRAQDHAFKTIVKHLIQTRKAVKRGDTATAEKLLSQAINALSKMFLR